MKNVVIGLVMGVLLVIGVKYVQANVEYVATHTFSIDTSNNSGGGDVFKFQDGNTNCYYTFGVQSVAISCVRTK